MSDILLVTIVIGDEYLQRYKSVFYENHQMYASKFGYDFIVVTDFLDPNNRHPSFISLQKSLVCSQSFSSKYTHIIYIDADILFNLQKSSPLHLEIKDDQKVLIANEYSQPTAEGRLLIQELNGWEPNARAYYKLAGLDLDTSMVLNTGVMIFNPKVHRKVLEETYLTAIQAGINHPRGFHFEQAMIGFNLQKNNCFELLSNEWNAIWLLQKISPLNSINLLEFYSFNKAVHFAGNCDVELIPELVNLYQSNYQR